MGQASNRHDSEVLDLVIGNALIIDWSGIYKVSPSRRGTTDQLTRRLTLA